MQAQDFEWHGFTNFCENFRRSEENMKRSKSKDRFDQLLQTMVSQPVPGETPATKARTSKRAASASYGDTRTREGKAASLLPNPNVSPVDPTLHLRPERLD